MTSRVAVAAPNALAAEAALRVAAEGGGAVDAAVAAAMVTMVTEPGIVSLAGGAFVTVWSPAADDAVTVDGGVAMPGLGAEGSDARDVSCWEIDTDYGGGVRMTVGPGSVAVPGALAALDLAQATYGVLPWRELVAPAIDAARDGWPMGSASGHYLPHVRESVFGWDPATAAGLRRTDGAWLEAGDVMVVPDLADTLSLIARDGARTMYTGQLGAQVATDQRERGGVITAGDLSVYRALVRPALRMRLGDWDLRTNPPPSIGGPVLAAMLARAADLPSGAGSVVAAQHDVLRLRRALLDPTGSAEARAAAGAQLLAEVARLPPGGGHLSPSTAHVSVVDADGTACAITTSYGYGSGVTVPGTGLWLNNCLGEHELNRGPRPAPGDRLPSNMAPTVARRRDGAVLAVGSPGADRITSALLQVLLALATDGAPLQDAVDRPRVHVHLDDDGSARVDAEADVRLGAETVDGLAVRRHPRHAMYFGGVAAAMRAADGKLESAADPRRAGVALVSP